MTELKTLKDLPHYFDREGNQILLFEPHIKAEAIKWVKHSNTLKKYPEFLAMKGLWMAFFNISEEDLK